MSAVWLVGTLTGAPRAHSGPCTCSELGLGCHLFPGPGRLLGVQGLLVTSTAGAGAHCCPTGDSLPVTCACRSQEPLSRLARELCWAPLRAPDAGR